MKFTRFVLTNELYCYYNSLRTFNKREVGSRCFCVPTVDPIGAVVLNVFYWWLNILSKYLIQTDEQIIKQNLEIGKYIFCANEIMTIFTLTDWFDFIIKNLIFCHDSSEEFTCCQFFHSIHVPSLLYRFWFFVWHYICFKQIEIGLEILKNYHFQTCIHKSFKFSSKN